MSPSRNSQNATGTPSGVERGRKYRFVVSSAEEAIATLRERLGTDAKVLSVKQIDGQGLSRFLKSPKLEIVATIPEQEDLPALEAMPEEPRPQAMARAANQPPQRASERPSPARREPPTQSTLPPDHDPLRSELEQELSENTPANSAQATSSQAAGGAYTNASAASAAPRKRAPSNVWTVLQGAGFDDTLLNSLRYDVGADKIEALPLPRALAEVNRRLREEYQDLPPCPVTDKIAFFGTPGVGKTTALCKRLASDVFMRRQNVQVLKLDSDTPNPDDALSLFCDVLGVPLWRDTPEEGPEEDAEGTLYVDLPGLPTSENEQWESLRGKLDKLQVQTRVLVINGMYEAGLIRTAFDLGESLGATHLVLTHMDEMMNAARLWPFLLRSGLSPFFASHGQNVTSDYSEDILRLMLEKTFPTALLK